MKKGFDSSLYLKLEEQEIRKRIAKYARSYIEIGGKLLSDGHASRVLPGYHKKNKIKLLRRFKNCEVIYCMNAKHLEKNSLINQDEKEYLTQSLKDLKKLKKIFKKVSVVITRFSGEMKALFYAQILAYKKIPVLFHKEITSYAKNFKETIKGYSEQPYIPVKGQLIIVTGPSSGSGKMAVCISQLYHELKEKERSFYLKLESFPVQDLPPGHPINVAYEAATANLQDKNKIDPYLKKYSGKIKTNYNRDINNYKILKNLIKKITKEKYPFGYHSPTDMGVNMIAKAIKNESVCRIASLKEIFRRKKFYLKAYHKGQETKATLERMQEIIDKLRKTIK